MIEGVKQQKWWGWGFEGEAYEYASKPKFPAFVKHHVGLDIAEPVKPIPAFDSLDVPPSRLGDELRGRLEGILGAEFVQTDDETRVVHAFGKGLRDLVRVRRGKIDRAPDVVIYPGTEEEVQRVVDIVVELDAVLIPFGGGSNIVGALEAEPHEERQVVSMNMGRMDKVVEIDEAAGIARIQAGVFGPDMEDQLRARGWTMGHQPDSFVWSTLGGWIATRSSGMQSDKYGDIADMVVGLRMVMPGQVLTLRPLPSTSSGPSVREMVIGSEGRLGVITEAWMQVHRIAEVREIQAYFFATYEDGLRACQQIVESDAEPMMARVSDALETKYIMANGKKGSKVSSWVSKGIQKLMRSKGWDLDNIAMSFVGFEGSANHVRYNKGLVGKIIKANNGLNVGAGPGKLYDQKKYDTPFLRDFMLDRGLVCDVSETTTPWSRAEEMHDKACKAFYDTMERIGKVGVVFCHLSHSYHSGACQYFTFAINDSDPDTMLETYDAAKRAIQQSFVDFGGTVSHHHGVGEEHSPWMAQDISPAGVHIQRKLFEGVDPGGNFNPGKIIHDGRPGITSNSSDA